MAIILAIVLGIRASGQHSDDCSNAFHDFLRQIFTHPLVKIDAIMDGELESAYILTSMT